MFLKATGKILFSKFSLIINIQKVFFIYIYSFFNSFFFYVLERNLMQEQTQNWKPLYWGTILSKWSQKKFQLKKSTCLSRNFFGSIFTLVIGYLHCQQCHLTTCWLWCPWDLALTMNSSNTEIAMSTWMSVQ